MLTHFGRIHLRPEWKESVVCIGTFDGVHRGHQEVIQTAVAEAARHEIPCALVTFDRHPASTLAPDRKPASIATLEQNLRAFRQMGVGIALVLPFDADMATKTAETFAAEILDDRRRFWMTLCAPGTWWWATILPWGGAARAPASGWPSATTPRSCRPT